MYRKIAGKSREKEKIKNLKKVVDRCAKLMIEYILSRGKRETKNKK